MALVLFFELEKPFLSMASYLSLAFRTYSGSDGGPIASVSVESSNEGVMLDRRPHLALFGKIVLPSFLLVLNRRVMTKVLNVQR